MWQSVQGGVGTRPLAPRNGNTDNIQTGQGGTIMSMPKDDIRFEMEKSWNDFMDGLERSMALVERSIEEARDVAAVCTDEWCNATEHVFDDINNALFSISEPRWADEETTQRIKALKRRMYDLYVNYRGVYEKLNAKAA
jgi:hypothetical protein